MRFHVSVLGALSAAFLLTSVTVAQAAGFDCKKATTDIEKLICKNHELSELDSRLTSVYRQTLDTTDTEEAKKRVKLAQQAWLTKTRNICREAPCLLQVYRQRIDVLEKEYFYFSRPVAKYDAGVDDQPTNPVKKFSCSFSIPGNRGGIYLSYSGDNLSDFDIGNWIVLESPDLRNGYTWAPDCEARLAEFDVNRINGKKPSHKVLRLSRKPEPGISVNFGDCQLTLTETGTHLRLDAVNPSECSLFCVNIRMVLDKKLRRCRILQL